MGWRPASRKVREGAAASVEKTNPTVEQSQPRHGLSHPGGVPLPTAAKKGTPQASHLNKGVMILSLLEC